MTDSAEHGRSDDPSPGHGADHIGPPRDAWPRRVSTLEDLAENARGDRLEPGDAGYDEARAVWNARIDREPAAVLRCRGAADVLAGVNVARKSDLSLSVKGGGHHVSGRAIVEDGLVLDCGPMDWVRVDPDAQTAHVGPGATWGDVDAETQAFGLAVPGGQDPNIGVPGLTLGGGGGWLSPALGLTPDNLRSVDVVTADGRMVHASTDRHPDLFWALRGGGGTVGVVTDFEFDLHPVGPEIFAGSLMYPFDEFATVARYYREFQADAPAEVSLLFGAMVLPDASVYPDAIQGSRVAILLGFYPAPPSTAREVFAPLRDRGDQVFDSLRGRRYRDWQRAGTSQGRMRTDLNSQYVPEISDAVIDAIFEHSRGAPSAGATVFVSPRRGAELDPAVDAMAYPHREPAHHVLVEARWSDPGGDDEHVEWVRAVHEALEPHTTGEVATNFLTADETDARRRGAFGENYERLRAIEAEWDPENLFHSHVRSD
ncbi:MAG: FAD-binding oxidoreductase [Haloarculaceae archaeon]